MGFTGDQRTDQQISEGMRLLAILPNGAVWNNGAGGYVLNGKLVSTTPQFVDKDDPNSLANIDPATYESARASGKTQQAATKRATVDPVVVKSGEAASTAAAGSTGTAGTTVTAGGFSMDDILAMLDGTYTPMSEADIMSRAAAQVDADLNTQYGNIANEEGTTNTKYSSLFSALDTSLNNGYEAAQRSATARGLGDSGIVDYERGKVKTNIEGQRTSLASQQATELANLANQRSVLQGSRSNLLSTAAGSIRDNDRATGTALLSAKIPLLNNILDKTNPDANNVLNSKVETVKAIGNTPEGDSTAMLGLRATGGDRVDWDAANNKVLIDGRAFDSGQLSALGGELRDNSWYLPKKALTALNLI